MAMPWENFAILAHALACHAIHVERQTRSGSPPRFALIVLAEGFLEYRLGQ